MLKNIKKEIDWLKEHAYQGDDGIWRCNISNEPIMEQQIGRSCGWGDVLSIGHLHCPQCEPNKVFPTPGTPIDYDNEVVEVFEEKLKTA